MQGYSSTLSVRTVVTSNEVVLRRRRRLALAMTAAIAAMGLSASAFAVERPWDGETSTAFSLDTNWANDTLPTSSLTADTAVFTGAVTTNQPTLDANYSLLGIDFQSAGWTIGGTSTFSLGASGISSAGTGTNTINANITQAVAGTWTIGTGNTLFLNGGLTLTAQPTITGGGNLTKGSTSAPTISGSNTYTGTTTIRLGTLNLSTVVAANTNGAIGNGSSALILGDAGTPTAGSVSNTNVFLQFNAPGATSFGRDIDATGATNAAATGRTRVAITTSGPANVDITGNLAFLSNAVRRFEIGGASGKTLTLSGLISSSAASNGTPVLVNGGNTGTGSLRLSNANNSYITGTTLVNGAVILAAGVPSGGVSPIGTGGFTMGEGASTVTNFSGGGTNNLSLLMENAGAFARTITLSTGATYSSGNGVIAAYTIGGTNTSGAVSFTGNINSPNAAGGDINLNLRATGAGTVTYSGVINENSNASRATLVNVNQLTFINTTALSGPGATSGSPTTGTVILTGANTYEGGTYIRGGTLLANNTGGSATGNGAVSVLSGATLGGTGGFTGALNVASGGIVSPGGNAIESLGSGPLTMTGGSTLLLDVNTKTATVDLLAIAGALSLDTTTTPTLSLINLDSGPLSQGTPLPIVTYTGAWNGGLFAVGGNAIADDLGTFAFGGNTFTIDYNRGGNTVALVAVPEPASAGLLGVAAVGLLARRRRR